MMIDQVTKINLSKFCSSRKYSDYMSVSVTRKHGERVR